MSNFFRDNPIGHKPRKNIFSKMRPFKDAESDKTGGSSIMDNPFFLRTEDSVVQSTPISKHIPDSNVIQSTPMSSPPKRGKASEEEELEITEVRDVLADVSKEVNNITHVNNDETTEDGLSNGNHNASSNDVLLEAFTNTQKICTSLKIELQKQQQKNSHQKQIIEQYKTEILSVTEKIQSHKNLLSMLEEQIASLKQGKADNQIIVAELITNYKSLNEKIKATLSETDALKTSLKQQKNIQKNLENGIHQKNKELDYVRKELDECSGQLSEEKIKYNELLHQITEWRRELVEEIGAKLDNKEDASICRDNVIKEEIINSTVALTGILDQNAKAVSGVLDANLAVQQSDLRTISNDLEFSLTSLLKSSTGNVTNELQSICSNIAQFGASIDALKGTLSAVCNQQDEFIKSRFPGKVDNLESVLDASMQILQNLPESIAELCNKVATSSQYETALKELNEKMQAIMFQKTQAVSILKSKDHEIEDLNAKLLTKTKFLDEMSTKNDELQHEIEQLSEKQAETSRQTSNLVKMHAQTLAKLESKVVAQTEIAQLQENKLKEKEIELQNINHAKTQLSEDCKTLKSKCEMLQQQVQKVNVELVQSKAKELEFGEINRNLKEQYGELESVSSDTSSSVRKLNDKIQLLEREKSGLNMEKLDLLEKIEDLENIINQIRSVNPEATKLEPPKRKASASISKNKEQDVFALSSDDLELTNPEYSLLLKPVDARRTVSKPRKHTRRKKLLLSDGLDESPSSKKTRRFK